ncbi:MAG TPA: enoyl-CoA hydratase-related protein [Acidimicrobiales bacterium]
MDLDELTDVRYRVDDGLAWITIDRADRFNAFRARTVDELIGAFKAAWADSRVGVVALTGAGDKAFCAGGDQKQRLETGDYGPSETGIFEVEQLHRVIRDIPKPVIAAVNGYAIGGGHVLHVVCDVTIASTNAVFGQTGPKVGSFDAGFGSAYLARVIGEKRAREIWMFCRQYGAQQALDWGLVNAVVEPDELEATTRAWADEALVLSPTALRVLKHSFNADSESIAGLGAMAWAHLDDFVGGDEAAEGLAAFNEKRDPDFSPWR